MLQRLVQFIQPIATSLGGPGLAVLAFLDSSFLSFPEVPDFLLVFLVTGNPSWWIYYAALTTLGSVAGCYALYLVARRGGEAMFRKRFKQKTFEASLALVRRYGLLAVVVPSLLPPPAPFKVFVILAGLSGIPRGRFLLAVVVGRSLRYFTEALLAYFYGERAMKFINENMKEVSIWLAVAIAVMGVAFVLWQRRRKASSEATAAGE
jgi:membrane protein YqaA with SNARE-associated domain